MINIYVSNNPCQVLASGQSVGQSVSQSVSLTQVLVQISSWSTNIFIIYIYIMIIYHSKIKLGKLSRQKPKISSLYHFMSIVGSLGPYFLKIMRVFRIAPHGVLAPRQILENCRTRELIEAWTLIPDSRYGLWMRIGFLFRNLHLGLSVGSRRHSTSVNQLRRWPGLFHQFNHCIESMFLCFMKTQNGQIDSMFLN